MNKEQITQFTSALVHREVVSSLVDVFQSGGDLKTWASQQIALLEKQASENIAAFELSRECEEGELDW